MYSPLNLFIISIGNGVLLSLKYADTCEIMFCDIIAISILKGDWVIYWNMIKYKIPVKVHHAARVNVYVIDDVSAAQCS